MLHRFKMLMNQQDGSPGGGAPAGTPGTPATPQAQGATPAAIDMQQLVSAVTAAVKDGVFADLRRSGVLKPSKQQQTIDVGEQPTPPAPQAQAASQDPEKVVQRMRSFDRAVGKANLTDAQVTRMEKALKADSPDDVGAWCQSYLEEMGLVKPNTPNATNNTPGTAPQASRSGPTMSDGGAPARDPGLATEGQVWRMTTAETDSLIREKGYAGAGRELRARLKQDLRGVRLLFRRPGG